ncbi:MAG: hypothetical protein ISQ14_14185 [Verrucomicrobiae bacterium]|jgi:MraZ protein|nr:hypothetical protein [Verrucomicrobiae bacterium]
MTANGNPERVSYKSLYRHGVDDKRRVQIPAKWRSNQDTVYSIYLWKTEGQRFPCLLVLPPRTAAKLEAKVEEMDFGDPSAESLRRLLGSNSDDVTVDRAGRICLPDGLAKKAGISGESVLVGLFDRFQLWNPEFYEQVEAVDQAHEGQVKSLI